MYDPWRELQRKSERGEVVTAEEMRAADEAEDRQAINMKLRDWFAGQIAVGLLSTQAHTSFHGTPEKREAFARKCYAGADAMLAAREKRGEQ